MKLKISMLLVCLIVFAATGFAQSSAKQKDSKKKEATVPAPTEQAKPTPPAPPADVIALKAEESNAAVQASTVVQQLIKKLNDGLQEVLEAPIEKATEVVARVQNTSLRLKIAEMEFNKIKESHRSTYQCSHCEYTDGAKSLARMKPQVSQAKP